MVTTRSAACASRVCFAPSRSTGKERDTESGNDYFLARYYASTMGRFLSPDWSAKVAPVPYARMDNPQTLNLYAYLRNNPLAGVDADGHCPGENCGKVQVTVKQDAKPHMIENQKVGDQYKSGVGTTLTITVTDNGKPVAGMDVKESNKMSNGAAPVQNPDAVKTSPNGTISDVVMKAVVSSSTPTDFSGKTEGAPTSAEMQDHVTTTPLTSQSTQTLTFNANGASCQATYTRTLTNVDAGGNLNTQMNSSGVNFTLTTTQPVVTPTPTQPQ